MTPTEDRDARPDQRESADEELEEVDPGWPWSFLLLVAAGAIYLIFRFIELGIKLFS